MKIRKGTFSAIYHVYSANLRGSFSSPAGPGLVGGSRAHWWAEDEEVEVADDGSVRANRGS